MRIRRLGVLAGLVAVLGGLPLSEPAQGADQALCQVELVLTLSPGLSRSPANQTFATESGSGKANCQGSLDGHMITGPGAGEVEGTMTGPGGGASCGGGEGEGTYKLSVPTDKGTMDVTGPFKFSFVTGFGEANGEGLRFVFGARPLAGDCISGPVTKAQVMAAGALARA